MKGRRLSDVEFGTLPRETDLQPGDYWRYLERWTGRLLMVEDKTNLTGTVWGFYSPDGNGMGTLRFHTVREHDDGSISVRPGDGSSNSILHSGAAKKTWHGYIEHGEWLEC